ncbi:MAG: segregation and condensation protein B [Candidatus Micrarchaeota archaeon]|nr:MAG: segregation and condensation protein B [Candidatus Micrarchaeota archaeon]
MDDSDYKKEIEALLFMSNRALTLDEISIYLGIGSKGYVKSLLEQLMEDYKKRDTAIDIRLIDNSYLMTLKDRYIDITKKLNIEPEFSKAEQKLLALLYKYKDSSVTQSEIIATLGKGYYNVIGELVRKGYIKKERVKRSFLLKLTKKFFDYFNVKSEQ